MITRLVKLPIKQEKTTEFRNLFENIKDTIKGFDGCVHLELFAENTNSGVHFTYSIWESEHHLNKYRLSEFFKKTWATTKTMLADKPDAWSLEKI
jgi:quinol monooxygenase YgiN